MEDSKINLKETSLHEIAIFPLGYFLENDLVPTASEKIASKQAFVDFEKNWKQLIDDNNKHLSEGYHNDSELSSEFSRRNH